MTIEAPTPSMLGDTFIYPPLKMLISAPEAKSSSSCFWVGLLSMFLMKRA